MRESKAARSYSPITNSSLAEGLASTNARRPCLRQAERSQPNPRMLASISAGGSSNVTSTPFSPWVVIPCARNCVAKTVFPLPGVPPTTVVRPRGRPPITSSSNALTPVLTRSSTTETSASSSCVVMWDSHHFDSKEFQHPLCVAQIPDDAARALGMLVREGGRSENTGFLGELRPL